MSQIEILPFLAHTLISTPCSVVTRGWDKPCVWGCFNMVMSKANGTVTVKASSEVFKSGDIISINGLV